jgi:hypothetical protein
MAELKMPILILQLKQSCNRYDMDHLNLEQPKSIVTQQDHNEIATPRNEERPSRDQLLLALTKQLQSFDYSRDHTSKLCSNF